MSARLLALLWLAACRPPGEDAPPSSSTAPSGTVASARLTAAPAPAPSLDQQALLAPLQGRYRVKAASEGSGHVFVPLIGEVVSIEGDTLKMPREPGSATEVRKTIVVVGSAGPLLHLDLVHRGHFGAKSTPEEDARTRVSPNSKGWGRVGSAKVEGKSLLLAFEFPQNPRPTDFTPSDSREIVTLERLDGP